MERTQEQPTTVTPDTILKLRMALKEWNSLSKEIAAYLEGFRHFGSLEEDLKKLQEGNEGLSRKVQTLEGRVQEQSTQADIKMQKRHKTYTQRSNLEQGWKDEPFTTLEGAAENKAALQAEYQQKPSLLQSEVTTLKPAQQARETEVQHLESQGAEQGPESNEGKVKEQMDKMLFNQQLEAAAIKEKLRVEHEEPRRTTSSSKQTLESFFQELNDEKEKLAAEMRDLQELFQRVREETHQEKEELLRWCKQKDTPGISTEEREREEREREEREREERESQEREREEREMRLCNDGLGKKKREVQERKERESEDREDKEPEEREKKEGGRRGRRRRGKSERRERKERRERESLEREWREMEEWEKERERERQDGEAEDELMRGGRERRRGRRRGRREGKKRDSPAREWRVMEEKQKRKKRVKEEREERMEKKKQKRKERVREEREERMETAWQEREWRERKD